MKRLLLAFGIACIFLLVAGGCGRKKFRVAHIYEPLAGLTHKQNFNWLQGIVWQFEKEHAGLPVQFEHIQWDKIDAKSIADYRAGVSHDVIMTSPQFMPQHLETPPGAGSESVRVEVDEREG